jgi:hypothetical protein
MNYTKISRELLKAMTFRPFEQHDYYGFSGVSSPVPMIGELESEGIVVVIDGDTAELYAFDGDGTAECVDTCENIRDLPVKTEKQIFIEAAIEQAKEQIEDLQYTIEMLTEQLK